MTRQQWGDEVVAGVAENSQLAKKIQTTTMRVTRKIQIPLKPFIHQTKNQVKYVKRDGVKLHILHIYIINLKCFQEDWPKQKISQAKKRKKNINDSD